MKAGLQRPPQRLGLPLLLRHSSHAPHATVSRNAAMLQRVLVMAPQASCDTVIDCLQSGKACSSREMAHDLLHDVHLDPSTHSVEKQCIATRNEVDALPLAEFSPQTRPRACSAGLRKGFLSSNAAKPAQQVSASKLQSCDVPLIKPSKTLQPGPEIPEFLRVPLTESERKGLLYRDILKEVMQPDDATLRRILEDSDLMNGFDDPAVMSAVADIAHNPAALSKHTAKVSKFYQGMGAILGPKLQQAAAKVTART